MAAGVTTEKADLVFASLPYRIMPEFQIPLYEQMKERDADFYAGSEKAGFWHDCGRKAPGCSSSTSTGARATTSTWALRTWWPTGT